MCDSQLTLAVRRNALVEGPQNFREGNRGAVEVGKSWRPNVVAFVAVPFRFSVVGNSSRNQRVFTMNTLLFAG